MSCNVNCPHCNELLQVEEEWFGMSVECPSCGKSFELEKNVNTPVISFLHCGQTTGISMTFFINFSSAKFYSINGHNAEFGSLSLLNKTNGEILL